MNQKSPKEREISILFNEVISDCFSLILQTQDLKSVLSPEAKMLYSQYMSFVLSDVSRRSLQRSVKRGSSIIEPEDIKYGMDRINPRSQIVTNNNNNAIDPTEHIESLSLLDQFRANKLIDSQNRNNP